MKKTSIICTLGPASKQINQIVALSNAGMNVARINMSHGSLDSLQEIIDNIKHARSQIKQPLSLILDTKGPEIRILNFKNGKVELKKGNKFTFTIRDIEGDDKIVSLAYKTLIQEVKIGDKIFANNGMLELKVISLTETDIECKVVYGGVLSNHKGLNIPYVVPKGNYISNQDKIDLEFAIKNDADYIAASFVSNVDNVNEMRAFLDENGGKDIKIIAKIENYDGVQNAKEIIKAADGIMVARGDLGVEIPLEKLPAIQKKLIALANNYGKIVVVATEMLESMTNNLRPTRAEVSDVANSIYEMTTATMLSGETAVGKHPVDVVKTMSKIIMEAEKNISYNKEFLLKYKNISSVTDAIAEATCSNALSLNAKLIVVFTSSGATANMISSFRITTPILALTPQHKIYNSLGLAWNVIPVEDQYVDSEEKMVEEAKRIASEKGFAKQGDIIIVVTGTPKQSGQTNMMKVVKI